MGTFFRKHWKKVLIIGIPILLLLFFAVIVSVNKTLPPEFPDNPNLADWLFYILDDWASAGAPVFTLILAIAAFLAIWQTRAIQKSEKRQRLLNEIIEWAIDVNNFALRHRTEAVEEQLENSFRCFLDSQLDSLFDQFEPFRSKSVYMAEIAPALGKELKSDVEGLIEALRSQIKSLHDYRRDRNTLAIDAEAQELAKNVAQNNNEIHVKAVTLIKRIAKSNVEDLQSNQ